MKLFENKNRRATKERPMKNKKETQMKKKKEKGFLCPSNSGWGHKISIYEHYDNFTSLLLYKGLYNNFLKY